MRLLNQFGRFPLSTFFSQPEFLSAVAKMINKCFKEQASFNKGIIINGLLLDDEKRYSKVEWAGLDLLIFANGVNRYLLPVTEYEILPDGGFKILIGDQPTVEDNYIVTLSNA